MFTSLYLIHLRFLPYLIFWKPHTEKKLTRPGRHHPRPPHMHTCQTNNRAAGHRIYRPCRAASRSSRWASSSIRASISFRPPLPTKLRCVHSSTPSTRPSGLTFGFACIASGIQRLVFLFMHTPFLFPSMGSYG
jgi:hypothetical protein